MQQTPLKLSVLFSLLIVSGAFRGYAEEKPLPRVVIFHLAGSEPNLDVIVPLLEDQLTTAGMDLALAGIERADFPSTESEWSMEVRKVAADARSVAALAYACEAEHCTVRLIQIRSNAMVVLSYARPKDAEALRAATAATLREIILGPLAGELRRLAEEAAEPSVPDNAETVLLQSPFESNRREPEEKEAPWLWLEAAYQGDYPHPAGRLMNGVSLGVDLEPATMLGFALHIGWLGMGNLTVESADIGMQRMNGALTVRLIFSLGPARIAIGAVGRLDLVFLNVDNPSGFDDVSDQYPEVHVGGITTWHLPLPGGLNFIIGAGLTASMVSREVEITSLSGTRETAMPASTLRMIWTAGVAFSPLCRQGNK